MFGCIVRRRRRKLMQQSFPAAWKEIIRRNVAHYKLLDEKERARLQKLVQILIAEKNWEGAGGLTMNDEIRVTIATQACLLILNMPHNYYRNVETVIVYPSEIVPPQRKPGFFETILHPLEPAYPIAGQAFRQGPLILAWEEVLRGGRHPGFGYNVVYHEFAHKLDMLDGAADGTPPLFARAAYREWIKVFSRQYLQLRSDLEKGKPTFLDDYGATDEAEFFAVATEHFFDQPVLMEKHAPEIYRMLKEYYRQDPAKRAAARK
ncbi:MAG TPA: zinc-dependent peptidase [Smithellaceae bacterium]|mgnify:CR=1 FL=1|nr:zinc-dependent peptidase [Smithellaceae bacterium]HRS88871.1 zinc-dependent peptidase [Smithellaceae bacterium]HRV26210.1 zinc-dependent peptidase [Smithellaceae bacterium]